MNNKATSCFANELMIYEKSFLLNKFAFSFFYLELLSNDYFDQIEKKIERVHSVTEPK